MPCRTLALCWLSALALGMGGSGDEPTSATKVLKWHKATELGWESGEKGRTEERGKTGRAAERAEREA